MVDDSALKEKYLNVSKVILGRLSSTEYRAELGENGDFTLKHGVDSRPHDSEIDRAITYGNYYYIEVLLRYKNLKIK